VGGSWIRTRLIVAEEKALSRPVRGERTVACITPFPSVVEGFGLTTRAALRGLPAALSALMVARSHDQT